MSVRDSNFQILENPLSTQIYGDFEPMMKMLVEKINSIFSNCDGIMVNLKIVKGNRFTNYKRFVENSFKIIERQALHAKSLGFIHPSTNKEVYFESKLPEDMSLLLDKWRKYEVPKSY